MFTRSTAIAASSALAFVCLLVAPSVPSARAQSEPTPLAHADDPPDDTPPPDSAADAPVDDGHRTVILGRRPLTAASASSVRDRDFLLRPHPRPADILQVVPGFYVVQHAGGGKANQYFLRGFDADHGTDVALSVDGVPVNMVSHGHGQGYADLNWIIPEVVRRIDVDKGPYAAEDGDFATAGAVDLGTHSRLEQNEVSLSGGMFDTYRGLLIASPTMTGWRTLLAAEIYATDGPFERGEGLQRVSLFGKLTRELSDGSRVSLTLTSYGAGWNASGQLPLRAVRDGRIDRFGTIDPDEGGNSQRHSAVVNVQTHPSDDSELTLTAYLIRYQLALYSNFTFFSNDPVHGDMIEQQDGRTVLGLKSAYRFVCRWNDLAFDTTVGVQVRHDTIDNALHHDEARERLGDVVDASVREASLGVFAQEEITWTPWLRTVLGLRADHFGFDVDDHLEDQTTTGTKTSGVAQAMRLSPKASVVLAPVEELNVFLNFGAGFHSNDARGVVRGADPVTPLTGALGYELGARTRLFDRLDLAVAAFVLDLESEIVWVGDAGTTEARGATQRLGGELEVRLEVLDWLFADFDMTLSNATYTANAGNSDAVALAPTFVMSGGVSARHPSGFYGRVGFFHLGDRDATEDGFITAEGFTRVDLSLGYRHPRFELSVAVQNLLDADVREAQFANVSRLADETSPASCPSGTRATVEGGSFVGCEDLHFTPAAPINVQASAKVFF